MDGLAAAMARRTGGFFTIGPQTATRVCEELNPKITIPMHYRIPGLRARLMFGFLHSVDDFLKGKTNIERINGSSITVEVDTLPKEPKIVLLSPH
jgi:L-ascorbate metabolism protein UlaG (beta-lactamase superfamily)